MRFGATTIHRLLRIKPGSFEDLAPIGDSLLSLQQQYFEDVKLLVIDEISMAICRRSEK